MPQISYRANLSASIFPLSLSSAGRTVIVPGPDNNYDRRVDPEGEQKDAGIPQAIYLENVIPTATGYQSVGKYFSTELPNPGGFPYIVNQIYSKSSVPTSLVTAGTLLYSAVTGSYLYSFNGVSYWSPVTIVGTAVYPDANPRITFALVRGECYILVIGTSNTALYTVESSGTSIILTNVSSSVLGLTLSNIVGICGSYNYLCALNADGTLHWSSTTTPTDFRPSLVTGAGSTTPTGVFGGYDYAHATSFGFYLFCFGGVVAAIYTGNSRYPWKFTPVPSSGTSLSAAIQDVNMRDVLVIDTAYTIYFLSDKNAIPVAPELSSYLRGNRKDYTYNFTNNSLESFISDDIIGMKLYSFYDRYILVSAGAYLEGPAVKYKIIIVYDIVLRRYGRLVHNHTHLISSASFPISRATITALDASTGQLCTFIFTPHTKVDWGIDHSNSILMVGKLQYTRSRRLELQEAIFDGQFEDVTCKVYPSDNGTNINAGVALYPIVNSTDTQQFLGRVEGQNLTVGIQGQFSVDSLELVFSLGAGR